MKTARDTALAAARRISRRQRELHPRHDGRATGYALATGEEFGGPFCGGPREGWFPPPGTDYVRADVYPDGTAETWVLRQPE